MARQDIAGIWTEGEYGFRNLNSKSDTSFGRVRAEMDSFTECYLFQPDARLMGIDVCYAQEKEVYSFVLPGQGAGYLLATQSDTLGIMYCLSALKKGGDKIQLTDWRRWHSGTKDELRNLLMPPASAPHPPKKLGVKGTADAPPEVVNLAEVMPAPGYNYQKYLATNIVYPKAAIRKNIEGSVIVSFIVQPSGKIEDPLIVRGLHQSLDDESLRVLSNMPSWIPGMQNGAPVPVRCQLPINFRLADK